MAANRTRIVAHTGFGTFKKRLHEAARESIEVASAEGAAHAKSNVPVGDGKSGVLPGHAKDTIDVMIVQKRKLGGWRAGFGSGDPTILWLDQGTHGRRGMRHRGKGKEGRTIRRKFVRQTKAGRASGIKPHRFMKPALVSVALPSFLRTLKARAGFRIGRIL